MTNPSFQATCHTLYESLQHYKDDDSLEKAYQFTRASLQPKITPMKRLQQWIEPLHAKSLDQFYQGLGHYWIAQTRLYLDAAWKQTMVPSYQRYITQRYPIDRQSSEDISLMNFQRFFAPQGLATTFYQSLLAPLIEKKNNTWQWKRLANEPVLTQTNLLEQYQLIRAIQKQWYHAPHHHLTMATDSISHHHDTLQSSIITPHHQYRFSHQNRRAFIIQWPEKTRTKALRLRYKRWRRKSSHNTLMAHGPCCA